MPDAATITVTTPDGLWSAIKSAKPGDIIELAPGSYSSVRLNGIDAGGVTITSADPGRPAVIAGLNITSSSGLTFTNLEITVNPANGFAVMLGSTRDMVFDRLNLHGSAVGDGNAVQVRNSTNVTVSNSDIHHLGTGLNHMDSNRVTFSGNKLHDIQADGIRGGGSSNVTITGNHFTNFYPKPGDHPDAIQFWTTNAKSAAENIVITNNTFVRGDGQAIQGIFVGNETQLTYQNVTITGNAIIGGMYHGISLTNGANVNIANNMVQGYADMTSWIMVGKSSGVTISGNLATDYKYDGLGNTGLVLVENTKIAQSAIGDNVALLTWQARAPLANGPHLDVNPLDFPDFWVGSYNSGPVAFQTPTLPMIPGIVDVLIGTNPGLGFSTPTDLGGWLF